MFLVRLLSKLAAKMYVAWFGLLLFGFVWFVLSVCLLVT